MKPKVIITSIFASAIAVGALYLYSNRMPYISIKSSDIDWSGKKAKVKFGGKMYEVSFNDAKKSVSSNWTFSDKYYMYIVNKNDKTYLYIIDSKNKTKEEGVIIDWKSNIVYNDVLAS